MIYICLALLRGIYYSLSLALVLKLCFQRALWCSHSQLFHMHSYHFIHTCYVLYICHYSSHKSEVDTTSQIVLSCYLKLVQYLTTIIVYIDKRNSIFFDCGKR